ncbi:MAG TPA: ATP-dependent helicase [Acidimicrobiales bacterium]|nr:ATP-dependent helicase [Acidimicrobiales bacterium]
MILSRSTPRLEELLAGCDAEQAEAIRTPAAPLCVLAGAGSGKTRVLTRRIARRVLDGSASAPHVLALTFTRKAASELRGRLAGLGLPEPVTAGTFHAVALSELRRLAAERSEPAPVVVASKARLIQSALASAPRRLPVAGSPERVHEVAAEIEWAKSRLVTPAAYPAAVVEARRATSLPAEVVAELFQCYELERRRRRVLDFEDLLTTCTAELACDPAFAASARWRWRHLFVDEYQDVNPAQLALLTAWCGGRDDLCLVGDPDQAIYGWNGSDPEAILNVERDFPGVSVLRLRTNYRSTSEVLSVAASVLGAAPAPAGGPVPGGPVPTVRAFESDSAEAAGVADAVRRAHRPGRLWAQIAVLARTNAQLPLLRSALERALVPCQVVGDGGFLRRPHLAPALSALEKAATGSALSALAEDLRVAAAELGAAATSPTGALESSGAGQEAADLLELARMVEEYVATDQVATGAGWRAYLEADARHAGAGRGQDAVQLMTFHRAKGLEWPVVFVTGLEDGFVPIAHARSSAAMAEERRLLYVACTRAEEELHCTWARERRFGDRAVVREASPFLEGVEAVRRRLAERSASSLPAAKAALAEIRRRLNSGIEG